MYNAWCGLPCAECKNPCRLDEIIPCSPTCEHLGKNGETDSHECRTCDVLQEFNVHIVYDGIVCIRASSADKAIENVRRMTVDDMYDHSDGVWDIDEAVKNES